MKKIKFLSKLKHKGILEFVKGSEEIEKSYKIKSDSYIGSSKLLLENGKFEEAVSMAYYSMYYILLSLLFKTGIKCENHSASIIILKEVFEVDNTDISYAKTERVDKQYYVDFNVTKEDVEDLIRKSENFRGELQDFISKLNSAKIEDYRKRLEDLL